MATPVIKCSECGIELGEDKLDDLPIGMVFALKRDGFKKDRAFCGQGEFEKFYSDHPEEHFNSAQL